MSTYGQNVMINSNCTTVILTYCVHFKSAVIVLLYLHYFRWFPCTGDSGGAATWGGVSVHGTRDWDTIRAKAKPAAVGFWMNNKWKSGVRRGRKNPVSAFHRPRCGGGCARTHARIPPPRYSLPTTATAVVCTCDVTGTAARSVTSCAEIDIPDTNAKVIASTAACNANYENSLVTIILLLLNRTVNTAILSKILIWSTRVAVWHPELKRCEKPNAKPKVSLHRSVAAASVILK